MTKVIVKVNQAGGGMQRAIVRAIGSARLDQVLVANAKRRIDSGGDSTHKYPELWATRTGLGYRSGGQPLRDTGTGYNSMTGETVVRSDRVSLSLIDGSPDARMLKNQNGGIEPGPNYVALTRRGARFDPSGMGKKEMRAAAINSGLREGKDGDFIVIGDAEIPSRLVYNDPPEDIRDLTEAVGDALGAA